MTKLGGGCQERKALPELRYPLMIGLMRDIIWSEVVSMSYDDVTEALEGGHAATIVEWSHHYSRIVEAIGSDKVSLTRLPPQGLEVIANYHYWVDPSDFEGSEYPDATWEFIKSFT
ncbi:MAG TPA: hypothetical protein GXX51_10255 [Firmicutes bacterium]|nr:hypothetical protein [Bacillota bacterium]